ncbi:MAG TPA: FecR domain-containing protein [Hyphomicrobiales bacterium]|nr:FecR domain-containing protein [Hyphomicrobiales bacterium]
MHHTASPIAAAVSGEPSHQVLEQAAEWYALLRSGDATDSDRTHWQAWLAQQPQHRQAWHCVEQISNRFESLQDTPDPRRTAEGLWTANERLIKRRRLLRGSAIVAGTALLGWQTLPPSSLPRLARAWSAGHRSATGEIRSLVLADGTQVWLNTAAAFDEHYDINQRLLQLWAGEILIATAGDAQRPFLVATPQGRLRALGTRFTVRLEETQTLLAVFEGAVEITTASGATSVVEAGQQRRFSTTALASAEPADLAREAWRDGILVARDIPLREVVGELRRYRRGYLGLAPEVAELRVFGNFPLHDPDAALDLLGYALPIRVRRTLPWWASIDAAVMP